MTELGELVLILAGLHAALGLHWFPRSAYVFRSLFGAGIRALPASIAWGSDRMALLFGPPLPGFGRFHLVELFPLSIGRAGVFAFVAQDPNPGVRTHKSGVFADWDRARTARAESRSVFLGRERFVLVGSDRLARHLASEMRRLALLEPAQREREIELAVVHSLDESRVREGNDAWVREARRLRYPTWFVGVFLFLALPAVWVTYGVSLAWPWLLAAVIAGQVWSGIAFHRAHKRLDPDERGERIARTLSVSLSPIEALRSPEILGRDLFAKFHPFAVGAALLARGEFELFAERVLRDARNPMPPVCPSDDERAIAVELEARERQVRVLDLASKRLELPPDLATVAPAGDADEHTYCPRCQRKYTLAAGTCSECWDLALVPLPTSARAN